VVAFTTAAADDSLAITAGDSIQLNTDGGAVTMTDGNGAVSGTLALTAHDIWVADSALLDQLDAAPSFEGFEGPLGTNNGAVNPDGYLQAGGITVTMLGSSFLVQNSGSAEQPGGLTVGDGGLHIVNQGSDPATVILFGQQKGGNGTVVTGDDFFEQVDFTGEGGFSGESAVNGCGVSGGCTPAQEEAPVPGAESILGPVGLMNSPSAMSGSDEFASSGDSSGDDEADDDDEDSGDDSKGSVDASVGLINTGPVSIETPIEEPVTSGSDAPGGGN
jgi:hypothetical protein